MKFKTAAFSCFFACFFIIFAMPAFPAQAHRLNVFAWLENDQIVVECNFGNNRPAIDAKITVLDKNTNQPLVNGTTDKTGHYAFPVPAVVREGHTLAIDVNAGDGHRSEWVMPASEIYAASSLVKGFKQEDSDLKKGSQAPGNESASSRPVSPAPSFRQPGENIKQSMTASGGGIAPESLRLIIRDEMENQLAPMRRELAARTANEPTLTEIIGGLGWIMGFVGIILYFLSRRKNEGK